MAVTVATVLARIRTKLNENTARMWQSSDLINWFNEGAEHQHHAVLTMARQQGKLGDLGDPYLRKYAKVTRINVTTGNQLYALPSDYHEIIKFTLSDPSLVTERIAQQMKPEDEWWIANVPHYAPTYDKPMWSLQVNPDETTGMCLKVFVFGDKNKPNTAYHGRLYYYRDITAANTDATGNTDFDDPYNEGPVWYAVGTAWAKAGTDPTPAMTLYSAAVQNIMAPLVSASASQADAQARGAQNQVASGESRESS